MNIGDVFALMPKLLPLMPRIEKAIDTIKRLEGDPAVQDALALGKELAQIFSQQGLKE